MRTFTYILAGTALAVFMSAGAHAETDNGISAEEANQIDNHKIYYGDPTSFENAGEVDLMVVVRNTPQYQRIDSRGVDRGTAQYWSLITVATEKAQNAVIGVAGQGEYDLIVEAGHLAKVDEEIPVEDITGKVVSYLKEQEEQ